MRFESYQVTSKEKNQGRKRDGDIKAYTQGFVLASEKPTAAEFIFAADFAVLYRGERLVFLHVVRLPSNMAYTLDVILT